MKVKHNFIESQIWEKSGKRGCEYSILYERVILARDKEYFNNKLMYQRKLPIQRKRKQLNALKKGLPKMPR